MFKLVCLFFHIFIYQLILHVSHPIFSPFFARSGPMQMTLTNIGSLFLSYIDPLCVFVSVFCYSFSKERDYLLKGAVFFPIIYYVIHVSHLDSPSFML